MNRALSPDAEAAAPRRHRSPGPPPRGLSPATASVGPTGAAMDEHTRDPSVPPPPAGREPTGWDADADRWAHATLRRAVVHGARLFNDRAYHGAHDCFEAEWYNYGRGTTESAFLHGLTQVAAGVHKRADLADDAGLRSLFGTARQYLHGVPPDYYGLDVDDVRRRLAAALEDPAAVDGWRLVLDGERPDARPADYAHLEGLE